MIIANDFRGCLGALFTLSSTPLTYTHCPLYTGFELVKQNQFAKSSECGEEKGPPQSNIFLDL